MNISDRQRQKTKQHRERKAYDKTGEKTAAKNQLACCGKCNNIHLFDDSILYKIVDLKRNYIVYII